MILYVKEEALGIKIRSAQEVFETLKDLGKADQETGWLLGFDTNNKEIFRGCIFTGGLNFAMVDLKILFKRVLVAGCYSFIFVHNHPSGSTLASAQDQELTKKIKQAADLLEIKFLDHIIIGGESFTSLAELGIL